VKKAQLINAPEPPFCSASGSLAYTNRGAQNVPIWVRGDLAEGRGQVGLASATVEEPALWGLTWQYQSVRYRLWVRLF
jgi:hypothetical protein